MPRTPDKTIRQRRPTRPDPARRSDDAALCERAIAAAKPIDVWPAAALQRLAAVSQVKRFCRGSRMISGGDRLDAALLIAQGGVEVCISGPDGRQFTYALGWQGAIFGMLMLFDGRGMPHDLNALDDVVAVQIPFRAIEAELAAAPHLWKTLAYDMAWRFRNLFDIVNGHALDAAPVRLASVLLRLARTEGEPAGEGLAIKLRLSQQRVGELIGVTRQTAMQHLHEMQKRGLIGLHYGRVTLLDPAGLQALAASQGAVRPG